VRNEIQKARERDVPTTIWQILRDMGRVSRAVEGTYQIQDLVGDIEGLEPYKDYLVAPASKPQVGLGHGDSHNVTWREASAYPELDAISEIMGIEASMIPEVVGFRRDILGGSLIPPTAVAKWIRDESEKAEQQGLTLSSQTDLDRDTMARQIVDWHGGPPMLRPVPDWPDRLESDSEGTLPFPDMVRSGPPSQLALRTRTVPVPARGPLWLLKFIALGIMEEYPWSEAQAVGFVVSGVVPRLPAASVTQYRLFPFRVVLDLDPGVTAKTVVSEYRRAQKELINVRKRAKAQSEKHLRLAVFVAQGRRGTWNDMMGAWNNQSRPEWAYNDSRRFQKEAQAAIAALRQRRDCSRMPSSFRRTEHIYGLR